MILPAQVIRRFCQSTRGEFATDDIHGMITPFFERTVRNGKSYGLSSAGYDIRVGKFKVLGSTELVDHVRMQNGDFVLAVSIERIKIPPNLLCYVKDKSSWAREGLAVQNTILDPGWVGYITLELSYHRPAHHIVVQEGDPIAQLIFHQLVEPTEQPYSGKYQNQSDKPVEAIKEEVFVDYTDFGEN